MPDKENRDGSARDNIVVGHHYDFIDGLRGIAVLAVIWFHASVFFFEVLGGDTSGYDTYYRLTLLGQTGVDLFFVISGFLITGILIDTADHEHKFKKFYIRRALRIFPIYYGFLLFFTLILVSQSYWSDVFSWKHVSFYIYMQNWSFQSHQDIFALLNHTWSLAVEEQFYLVWPCLFWFLYKRSFKSTVVFCCIIIASSIFLRLCFSGFGYHKFSYTATFCRLDGLIIGALISVVFCNASGFLEKLRPYLLPIMVGSTLAMLVLLIGAQDNFSAHTFMMSYGIIFLNICFAAMLIMMLFANKNVFKSLLCNRFF